MKVLREAPSAVAIALGVSQRTVAKWVTRYRAATSTMPRSSPSARSCQTIKRAIADAIEGLIGSPGLRQRLSDIGRLRAEDFSLTRSGAAMMDLYRLSATR